MGGIAFSEHEQYGAAREPNQFKYLGAYYQITPGAVAVQAGSTMFSTHAHRRKRIETFVVYITMALFAAIVAGFLSQQLFQLMGL